MKKRATPYDTNISNDWKEKKAKVTVRKRARYDASTVKIEKP